MLDFLYKLEINAPALEYLEFVGFLHKVVLLENLSNLVKAVLFVSYDSEVSDTEDYGNRVMDFIRALYSVKSLHLGSYTTEVKRIFHFLLLIGYQEVKKKESKNKMEEKKGSKNKKEEKTELNDTAN